ncbi:MAG TPA: hypothetical protein VNX88_07450 [Terriglobales bacterium]|nr:hypothetical protein [Terriglobales bacterium]
MAFAILVLLANAAFAQKDTECANLVLDQSATLADVFTAACIPERMARNSLLDLRTAITSYAVLNSSMEFVIAYYERVEGSDLLKAPLHVARFARGPKRWFQNELFKDGQAGMFQTPCMGSAVSVHRVGLFILVGTHINPHLECMQGLDSELKLKDTRYGRFVTSVSGRVVYEHNTTEFAPTHPLVLSLYDPSKESDIPVYPLPSDREREEFINQLNHLVAFERCEGQNCSVLPDQFESTVTQAVSEEKTASFAFIAEFSPVGYVRDVKQSEVNAKVAYVYRLVGNGVEHCEFPAAEMKSRFGTDKLNELLARNLLIRVFGD